MHAVGDATDRRARDQQHEWVGAALVGLGRGVTQRADHAARTGNHVLLERTQIEVLEVYCGRCRLAYTSSAGQMPCTVVTAKAG